MPNRVDVPLFPPTLPVLANVDTGSLGLMNLMTGINYDEMIKSADAITSLETGGALRGVAAKLQVKRMKTAGYHTFQIAKIS